MNINDIFLFYAPITVATFLLVKFLKTTYIASITLSCIILLAIMSTLNLSIVRMYFNIDEIMKIDNFAQDRDRYVEYIATVVIFSGCYYFINFLTNQKR